LAFEDLEEIKVDGFHPARGGGVECPSVRRIESYWKG